MLMETFDRLSRQDKYVWDVRRYLCPFPVPFADIYVQIIGHVCYFFWVRFGTSA